MLKIHSPTVGGFKHSFAILQCVVEAYPPAVNYWERQDGRLVQEISFGRFKGKVCDAPLALVIMNNKSNNNKTELLQL